ncbi:hypothetical protein [Kitasatospora griseola]|uniref:hypothetical protein n=1 Tax=Kitasatospora griseola TaxID=2064 RepID=UPI00382E3047
MLGTPGEEREAESRPALISARVRELLRPRTAVPARPVDRGLARQLRDLLDARLTERTTLDAHLRRPGRHRDRRRRQPRLGLTVLDLLYASLRRKEPGPAPTQESSEVVGILWAHAHALPGDALQHVTVLCRTEQVDVLLYLLTRHPAGGPSTPVRTAHPLLARSYRASPLLARRYHRPTPTG